MSDSIFDNLPSLIPRGEIRVEEKHELETAEYIGGPEPQLQYTLNKAPVNRVEEIVATVDAREQTLEAGTDYVVNNSEEIDFDVGGDRPDNNTTFTVTYLADSLISRYIDEIEQLIGQTEHDIEHSCTSNYVDQASGEELDRIGALFGDLGQRVGRDDKPYRRYLKSIVQSFSGRGTLQSVKFAVSSGLGEAVDIENVTIEENFDDTEYLIEIDNFGDLEGIDLSTVNELAQLSDPSGVNLRLINFLFDAEISELVATEDFTTTIEQVRVAHANDGDRAQIDVNSLLDADFNKFITDDELISTEETNQMVEEVQVVGWNEAGRTQIDVNDDGGAVTASPNRPEDEQSDTLAVDETTHQMVEQVLAASFDYGRGNIDVTADDNTEVIGDDPALASTSTESQTQDETTHQMVEEVRVLHTDDDDRIQIDSNSVLDSAGESFTSTDDGVSDDTQSQRVEQVETAYYNDGRGNIDVFATN